MAIAVNTLVIAAQQVTVSHNLGTTALSVRFIVNGEVDNSVISNIVCSDSDPQNILTVYFKSFTTGRVQVITDDFIYLPVAVSPNGLPGSVNYSSIVDPTTEDNNKTGYKLGSTWINTTYRDLFLCTAANGSSATWEWQNNFSKYITLEKTATQGFTTTLSDVLWNNSTQNVSDYYSYSSNIITINRSGDYRLNNALVSISSGGAATSHKTIVVRNRSAVDFVLPLSECYRTVEQNDVKTGGINSFITSLLQGDQLRMRVQVFTGTQGATIQPAGTYIQIERVG